MTIEEMKKRKIERGLSNKQLAELSGVPLGTLQRILAGKTKAPRRDTVEALTRALETPAPEQAGSRAAGNGMNRYQPYKHQSYKDQPGPETAKPAASAANPASGDYFFPHSADIQCVRETVPQYGRRVFTLKDYLALPDDQRVELIDGVFYDMAGPTTLHQMIVFQIQRSLWDHVEKGKGPCIPLASPVDVVLDNDQYTVVQPDVLVVCDRDKFRDGRVYGAPDLVVEVLSPSTRKKDISLKLYKYTEAGVREYWIVDPPARQIVVFDLEHNGEIAVYGGPHGAGPNGAGLKVPVSIWDKEHVVDFEIIFSFAEVLEK